LILRPDELRAFSFAGRRKRAIANSVGGANKAMQLDNRLLPFAFSWEQVMAKTRNRAAPIRQSGSKSWKHGDFDVEI
jgi:hypothetical protein